MSVLFLEYPKCSTCKKAKKWLDEHGVEYVDRDITTENPTVTELAEWHACSGLPLRRLFNTSGMKYRELGIKAKLDAGMTDAECFDVLATDGMLVKRPLLVGDDFVIPGFKEETWAEALGLRCRLEPFLNLWLLGLVAGFRVWLEFAFVLNKKVV